jgi:hypothetical protein
MIEVSDGDGPQRRDVRCGMGLFEVITGGDND